MSAIKPLNGMMRRWGVVVRGFSGCDGLLE